MLLAKVYIIMKPTVNDPEGLTIRGGLHLLGFQKVERVRSGKYLEITLEETERGQAEEQVREMCRQLLANPLIEDFRFELDEAQPSSEGPMAANRPAHPSTGSG